MTTLLLIDGNSLMNRAYYGVGAHTRLTSPDHEPTGAVMAFLAMLHTYLERHKPTHALVAFDRPEPTFRHRTYADYKAGRAAMPPDLCVQMSRIKALLDLWPMARSEAPGYEADDLIGTYARQAQEAGMTSVIVSGDQDVLQLVAPDVVVVKPTTKDRRAVLEVFDEAAVVERYGVEPARLIDVKALMGDASDHVPGVRGIGKMTATNLIQTYGSLDGVYDHLDALSATQRKKLEDGRDDAWASRRLVTIDRYVDPAVLTAADPSAFVYRAPGDALGRALEALGLRQLLARYGLARDAAQTLTPPTKTTWDALTQTPGTPLALAPCGGDVVVGDGMRYTRLSMATWVQVSASVPTPLIVWDVKTLWHTMGAWPGVTPFDVCVAQGLIEPRRAAWTLDETFGRYQTHSLAHVDDVEANGALVTAALVQVAQAQRERLVACDLTRVFDEIETPLISVLYRMEARGVLIDRARLKAIDAELARDMARLEAEVNAAAGGPLNINSPKQLGHFLFETLGLPAGKTTKGKAYSTSQEELDRLEPYNPIVSTIKTYRGLAKLSGTFVTGLDRAIQDDGRIHTTYTQVDTTTGRLSSQHPNVQNIPVRTERGRVLRTVFVAAPGYVLLDADYAQIELRLLAHLADDTALKAAFAADEDVHAVTAASLFHVPVEAVTREQRDVAKTVNFSIVYGVGDYGLAKSLGTSPAKARSYIERHNALYKNVRRYLDEQVAQARETGYVTTLTGRRRHLPELKSSQLAVRRFGERAAMNAPVQGTAADLIKIAMCRADARFREEGLDAHLILQVHDELLVEVKKSDAERARALLKDAMEGAMDLSVALSVDVGVGSSWGEAKA